MLKRGWSLIFSFLLLSSLLLQLLPLQVYAQTENYQASSFPLQSSWEDQQNYYLKVYFSSALINGVTLSASNPEITVQPGATLEGYFEVRVENVQPGSWITPVIGTASWTRRQFSCIADWAPTGTSNQRYTFRITAPNTPGTYYIGIFTGWMYTCDEVASNDHPPNYDDGDDVWDMSSQRWEEVIRNGQASTGPYQMPGRAIRIVVQQNYYLRVKLDSATLNGQGLSTSNPELRVNPGSRIAGTITFTVENVQPGSWITPVIWVTSWERGTVADGRVRVVASDIRTTRQFTVNIDVTAPSNPGTYYIGFFTGWMYNADEVASNDHPPNYGDGDDVWDMPGQGWEEVIRNGQASTGPYRMPGRAVRIVVQQPQEFRVEIVSYSAPSTASPGQTVSVQLTIRYSFPSTSYVGVSISRQLPDGSWERVWYNPDYQTQRSGQGTLTYTATFTVPTQPGTYRYSIRAQYWDGSRWIATDEKDFNIQVQQQQQLSVDVWTNKGGQGRGNLDGGQYVIGESIALYCSVNTSVDSLRIKVIRPDGVELTALERGPSPAGTYQASGTAGEPAGERKVICEARLGGQSSSDEVQFTVVSPSDTTPPTVRVIAPNGGERLSPGSVFRIRWEASDNVGVTGLYIRLYQEGIMRVIIADNPPNTGYYDWTVPNRPGSNYKIVVIARDAAGNFGEDESDGTFEIVAVAQGTLQHIDLDYRGTPPNSDGSDQTTITASPCSSFTLFFYYREGNTGNPYIIRVYPEWDKDRFIVNSDNNEAAPEGERSREEGGFRWDVETYTVPCTPGTYKVRVVYRGSHTPPTWDSYDRLLAEGTVIVQPAVTATLQVGIRHTYIGDLRIWVGVEGGREVLIWNREGGSTQNLFREWNLLQLGFTVNDLPPSESKRWYLRIKDEAGGDEGRLEYFRIIYQEQTYESQDHPEIRDFQEVRAWIPSRAQPPTEWETLLTVRVPGTDNTQVVFQVKKLGDNRVSHEQWFTFSIEIRDVNGQAPRDEAPFIRGGKLYLCYDRRTGPNVGLPTRWVPIPPNTEFGWYYTQYRQWGRVLMQEYMNALNERGAREVAQNIAINAILGAVSMGADSLLRIMAEAVRAPTEAARQAAQRVYEFLGWIKSFGENLLAIFGVALEEEYRNPSYPDSFQSIVLNRNDYVCQEILIVTKPRYLVGIDWEGVTGWSADYVLTFPQPGNQQLIIWFYIQYDRVLKPDAYIRLPREERIVINIAP
jgi:subtilisin-like proprotein convertase family protein